MTPHLPTSSRGSRLCLTFCLLMLTGAAAAARAADAPVKKRRVLVLDEMKVEGRRQRPQAVFFTPRASPVLEELQRLPDFVPQVSKATEKAPF